MTLIEMDEDGAFRAEMLLDADEDTPTELERTRWLREMSVGLRFQELRGGGTIVCIHRL